MKEIYYKVAGHAFVLQSRELGSLLCDLRQYEPFATEPTEDVVFRLEVADTPPAIIGFEEQVRQEDEGQHFVAGHVGRRMCFEFWLHGKRSTTLLIDEDFRHGVINVERDPLFGIDNALIIMYALATVRRQTAVFHASVVSYRGRGYLFLGPSGTGKSTHSRLWLEHIKGAELVNDDNPVVRIEDGEVRVYGTPWSGKTPCYRNVSYPVGGIVHLSQAPHNVIRRLKGIESYAVLMSSISGVRWDKGMAEGLHDTENRLAQLVAVWHLDCLPDAAAAELSCSNCAGLWEG